jgi:hypothetical protein
MHAHDQRRSKYPDMNKPRKVQANGVGILSKRLMTDEAQHSLVPATAQLLHGEFSFAERSHLLLVLRH